VKHDAASDIVGRSIAVCLLEITAGNGCVSQYVSSECIVITRQLDSAIVLFIGDFHGTVS